MSNYSNDVARVEKLQQQANFEASNLAGIRQVFKAFPAISPHEANMKILEAFCAPGPVSLAEVSWGLQPGNSNLTNELSIRSEYAARVAFATEISLYAGDSEREYVKQTLLENLKVGGAYANTAVAEAPKFTTTTLQAKAEEATRRRVMRGKTVTELREIVRTGNKTAPQRPALPAEYTAQAIKRLDSTSLLKIMRQYGDGTVNDRLNGNG